MDHFEWDDANVTHIALHGVSTDEAEQALTIAPLDIDSYVVESEVRFEALGETAAGRILKVLYILPDELHIRVITAYDAAAFGKQLYLRSRISI
jgi:uncharacterized DUF497 family protein